MNFLWVTMHVSNLNETQKFYEDIVGLTQCGNHKIENGEITFLEDSEWSTKVELIYLETANQISIGNDISLGFQVDSIDDMYALAMEKGLNIASGIISPNPHIKFFFVYDPNGVKVQFVQSD